MGQIREFLGAPLAVALPVSGDTIVIHYLTSPNAAAVQWLSAEQTAGGKAPFLFTQGESILTRTWIPTQDGPGIRQTYDATVHVPGHARGHERRAHQHRRRKGRSAEWMSIDSGWRTPIPPYLIALAVGDTRVSSDRKEHGRLCRAASRRQGSREEFAEVDQMVDAASRLYGPYRWGRYDILVLPPSFPFGGMENPTLTFATPTALAGDHHSSASSRTSWRTRGRAIS